MKNEKLRNARKKRGFSQQQLAKKVGVEAITVRKWEDGTRNPSSECRNLLCAILEMTATQLGLEPDNTSQEVSPTPSEEPAKGDQNRRRMLKRVRTRWISGVLDHSLSLYQGTFIHLRLQECPSVVINPWATITQESNLPSRSLAPEISILDVYDEAADAGLLILGEPGAGKTMLLLELARDLIACASRDETHPMPVIFNLSSWAQKRPPLMAWLIDELNSKYQIPRKLATLWIYENHILPLLDGLDEVAEAYRTQCIQAINTYHQEHGFVPMVVCCRTSEYLVLGTCIAFDKAISIEPLSWEEIENHLSQAGTSLQNVKLALRSDPGLQEMASTPLMLQIIAQTFRILSIDEIMSVQDPEARRRLIFEKYIDVVLKRRMPTKRYSSQQTIYWLSHLARYLQRRNETEFYLERMQQDWLEDDFRQTYHQTLFRIIYGILTFVMAGLFAWLGGTGGISTGLLGWHGAGPSNSILGWMEPGMGGGLRGGGMLGLIFVLTTFLTTALIDSHSQTTSKSWPWKSIQKGILSGLKNALLSGGITAITTNFFLLYASHGNLSYSLPSALGPGLFSGTIIGLSTLLSISFRLKKKNPSIRRKWTSQLLDGIWIGACAGLGFGIVTSIQKGILGALLNAILVSAASIFLGITGGESLITLGEIVTAETILWSWQNMRQHLVEDTIRGASLGLSVTVLIFFILSLASGLFYGPHYGMSYGVIYGIITGLIVGVVSLLTAVLNRGWESSLLSQDRLAQPNEGIRRSLRHSLFPGLIFGPIGGLASGLVAGFAFGLIGGLPTWPVLAIGLSIVFTLVLTLQFTLIRGSIACIEHYVLRWFLWRKKHIPLDYATFLNYAAERILLRRIGGGYMFSHRLLLEYFASLETK